MMIANRLLLTALACFTAASILAHDHSRLTFVPNLGQWDSPESFRTSFDGGKVFLESNCFTYHFYSQESRELAHDLNQASFEEKDADVLNSHAWKMHFVDGASQNIIGKHVLGAYHNYFLGKDPANWRSNVSLYRAVRYDELYAGVDLMVHSRQGNFKYDFYVSPGTDPAAIKLSFEGLDDVQLTDEGKLMLQTSIGQFIEAAPYAFQMDGSTMVEVVCRYTFENGEVGFDFPEGYDVNKQLVIDPELIAATLSGSTGDDNYGHTATFDLEGNIYTGAISFGSGYPTTTGAISGSFNGGGTDWGISKLTPDGTDLIYATYIGGNSSENPHSMFANGQGELYVYGTTSSDDFPALANAYQPDIAGSTDIAIAYLSEDGTELLGCTYVGGSEADGLNANSVNYGDSYRGEIILDFNGNALVASASQSNNFPVSGNAYQEDHGGMQDAVFFRLNPSLTTLQMSTYLGGDQNDQGYGLRVAASGEVVGCGSTASLNFPTTAGVYQPDFIEGADDPWLVPTDAFVCVLSSDGSSLNASTYVGTESSDQAFFLDIDTDEEIWIYGQGGGDMPVIGDDIYVEPNSGQFVAEFDMSLTSILKSTTIGTGSGSTDMVPIAFLVDQCDNVYLSAHSASWDLTLTDDALYDTGGFYLSVFSADMEELEYGTYYTEGHVDGGTSRFDKNGRVYQGVCSGGGFATTADAWATDQIPWWDIGVFKIDFDVSGVNAAISGSDVAGCAPFPVTFSNYSEGDQFFWDFGDGFTSEEFEPTHIYEDPGTYDVMLIVSDSLSCNLADTSYFPVTISTPEDFVADFAFTTDCSDLSVTTENLTGLDFLVYEWDMGDGTVLYGEDVFYQYDEPGTYEVSLTAIDEGCEDDETIIQEVSIYTEPVAEFDVETYDGCAPFNFSPDDVIVAGATITWDFGDGSPVVTGASPAHTYEIPGFYEVIITATGTGECTGESIDTAMVEVIEPPLIEALFTAEQSGPCEDRTVTLTNNSVGADLTYDWFFDNGFTDEVENPEVQSYNSAGTYFISLQITEPVCNQESMLTVELDIIDEIIVGLPEDFFICPDGEGVEAVGPDLGPETTYEWSTGEETQSVTLTEPGNYQLIVTTNNCSGSQPFNVEMAPDLYEVRNLTACEGTQTQIDIPFDGSDYEWCNGEATQELYASEPGDYCFHFVDLNGCLQEGLIILEHIEAEARMYVPNAFTPNNDGINDVFQAVGDQVPEFDLSVFNRWGEVIFETEDQNVPWLGNFQGGTHYVPDGVYSFKVSYRGLCGSDTKEQVGTVTVVR